MNAVPLLVIVLAAAQPDHIAAKIALKESAFDELDDALHIVRKSGTVQLAARRSKGTMEIELYKDGKKRPVLQGAGLETAETDSVRFVLQAIDMDYLTLGDGKKKHCRLLLKLGLGDAFASSAQDVPKDVCDFSKMTSGASFAPQARTDDRVPVCWMIGNTTTVRSALTPKELVESNPEGELAIIYIRLSK